MENYALAILVFLPILGAVLSYLVGRRSKPARDMFASAVGICEFILAALLFSAVAYGEEFELLLPRVCGVGLSFRLDGFRALYAAVAALMWMMTTLFSGEYLAHYRNRNRYYLMNLLTLGATVGVLISDDLFTTFVFFEVMSFTSYVLVVHDEKPAALRAGETYIAVAVIGGMSMLMGLFMLYNELGTLSFDGLHDAVSAMAEPSHLYLPGALVLLGFGAKAGMFPLHIWLPKAHPVAPAPASALLSGILTKTGIFGIIVLTSRVFAGDVLWGRTVLALGVVTMLLGAVIALFSIDLKRTLACSSMSQIGFILLGIGLQALLGADNGIPVWGTVLHMVNHSLIKLVLFMCAGVVYMNLHKLDLNEIRGWGRNKPFLNAAFLMGALAISGVPLWSGYISKTLLHEGIVEYIALAGRSAGLIKAVEWIFLVSGGFTAAYMTKLYVAIFVEKPRNPEFSKKTRYCGARSWISIGVPAILLPLFGMAPDVFMTGLGGLAQGFMGSTGPEHAISWFSLENLKGAAISLGIGAAVYLLFVRGVLMRRDNSGDKCYVNLWPPRLDLENMLLRPLVETIIPFASALILRVLDRLTDWLTALLRATLLRPIPVPERNEEDFAPGSFLPNPHRNRAAQRISASVSFSLLLFGGGLCAAILYLIIILVT